MRPEIRHATSAGTADGGLGDALDVVTKDLPVALGTTLSKTFSSLSNVQTYFTFKHKLE